MSEEPEKCAQRSVSATSKLTVLSRFDGLLNGFAKRSPEQINDRKVFLDSLKPVHRELMLFLFQNPIVRGCRMRSVIKTQWPKPSDQNPVTKTLPCTMCTISMSYPPRSMLFQNKNRMNVCLSGLVLKVLGSALITSAVTGKIDVRGLV